MTLAAGNNIDTTTSSTCCCLSSSTIVYRFSRRQSVIVGLVTMFALMALMLVYYSVDTQTMVSAFVMPKSAPAHYSLDQMKEFAFKNSIHTDYKPSYYTRRNLSFSRIIEDPNNRFNIVDSDVIVFLHIQKTAGTSFEKYLVKNLDLPQPCTCNVARKRCHCRRPGTDDQVWLFSRYSTGWICGLHADYTELAVSGCVDNALDKKEASHRKRRYFYTTFLRDPIARFISEYRHVERGATWLASRHICNGRPPTPDQLPMCFDPEAGWSGVTLDEFLACPYNLAFNRQTRMLADLTLINCYDTKTMDRETREKIMLESAKRNLKSMAYFGLKERMLDSQWMFEQLFRLRFTKRLDDWSKSKSNGTEISDDQMKLIVSLNQLDIQLYDYAIKLFEKRLKILRANNAENDDAGALQTEKEIAQLDIDHTPFDIDTMFDSLVDDTTINNQTSI